MFILSVWNMRVPERAFAAPVPLSSLSLCLQLHVAPGVRSVPQGPLAGSSVLEFRVTIFTAGFIRPSTTPISICLAHLSGTQYDESNA